MVIDEKNLVGGLAERGGGRLSLYYPFINNNPLKRLFEGYE